MQMPYGCIVTKEPVEILSLAQLEQLIEDGTAEALKEGMPLGIELRVNLETDLGFSVGHTASHLEFYSIQGRDKDDIGFYSQTHPPQIVVSLGPWDSEECIELNFTGEPSSVPLRHCVPIADALEAVRCYYKTGARPDNIQWIG